MTQHFFRNSYVLVVCIPRRWRSFWLRLVVPPSPRPSRKKRRTGNWGHNTRYGGTSPTCLPSFQTTPRHGRFEWPSGGRFRRVSLHDVFEWPPLVTPTRLTVSSATHLGSSFQGGRSTGKSWEMTVSKYDGRSLLLIKSKWSSCQVPPKPHLSVIWHWPCVPVCG